MRKIKGHPDFIRDSHSGAIINNDTNSYQLYKKRQEKAKEKDDKISKLEAEVADLKKFVNEMIEAGIAGRTGK